MTLENVEGYWSRELRQDVEIVQRGWRDSPDDFALYIDGTHVVSYKNLAEIEDYLSRYFLQAAPYDDMRDGL